MKKIIREYPVYLILFCVLAPLSLIQIFGSDFRFHDFLPTLVLLLAFCLILFLISRKIFGDRHLAGLATLGSLTALFPLASVSVPAFPVILLAGLGLLAVRMWRRRRHAERGPVLLPPSFTCGANVIAAFMMVAILGTCLHDMRTKSSAVEAMSAETHATIRKAVSARAPQPLPNVVHIVLDGYSRADVLRDVYGFDNTPFLNALRQRGFHVADHATTPFNQTLLVMSSIFQLRPVTDTEIFAHPPTGNGPDHPKWNNVMMRRIMADSVRYGSVSRALTDLGYQIDGAPSAFRSLQFDTVATSGGDTSFLGQFFRPDAYLFSFLMLNASPVLKNPAKWFLGPYISAHAINYDNLIGLPKRQFSPRDGRPRYVFEHILAPHPPFNITADGMPAPPSVLSESLEDGSHMILGNDQIRSQYRIAYLNKLRYVNSAILAHIDYLKKTLEQPLVIILHGDHGGGLYLDQNHVETTCVKERFKPLLAVFATDDAVLAEFSDDFNIVNIYRALFRAMLDADLPNLPDRHTFVSWEMDEVAAIDRVALQQSCNATPRVWTAEDNRPSPQRHPPSVSR